MSNEYAIEILEDRLKFCKEHLTEMGSVIPGLQQAINLLQSDVIVSGKLGYKLKGNHEDFYIGVDRWKDVVDDIEDKFIKYNGEEVTIHITKGEK